LSILPAFENSPVLALSAFEGHRARMGEDGRAVAFNMTYDRLCRLHDTAEERSTIGLTHFILGRRTSRRA
jgi:hypothetical protein